MGKEIRCHSLMPKQAHLVLFIVKLNVGTSVGIKEMR